MENRSTLIYDLTPDELEARFRDIVRNEITSLNVKSTTPKLFTSAETAKILRISLPTLKDYTRKGIIQELRIGSRVLYSKEEVERLTSTRNPPGV